MGTQRAERGYHPGLFGKPNGSTPFSVEGKYSYWSNPVWKGSQGSSATTTGNPLEYFKEDWQLKVPLEYLT